MNKPTFAGKRKDVILVQDRISKSSKSQLRPALRARRITPYSTGIQPVSLASVIINFGGGKLPEAVKQCPRILNPPDKVALSSNKLRTFELLTAADVPCIRWTVDKGTVAKWIAKGHKVLARKRLDSSGGRAIEIISAPVTGNLVVPDAPLFTRYFPKTHEFRVHVVGSEAIDLVEKKIKSELKDKVENRVIRSHRNGWVFAHDNLSLSHLDDLDILRKLAVQAVGAVGLDFGAVDLLCTLDTSNPRRLSRALVCELNAAPGIENTVTCAAYVKGLNALIEKRKSA